VPKPSRACQTPSCVIMTLGWSQSAITRFFFFAKTVVGAKTSTGGSNPPPLRQILYLIQTSSLGGTRNNAISIASNPTRQNLLANCWPGLREVRKTVAH